MENMENTGENILQPVPPGQPPADLSDAGTTFTDGIIVKPVKRAAPDNKPANPKPPAKHGAASAPAKHGDASASTPARHGAKPRAAKPAGSAVNASAAKKTNPAVNAKDDNAEKTFDDPLGHVKFTAAECNEKLLQGIYQAASMFMISCDALKPKIKDQKLKDTLALQNEGVDNIIDKTVRELRKMKIEPKTPALFTRAAAWMGIQFNSMISAENRHIAEMMIEGCTMGIYSCVEHIYDYQKADKSIKALCEDLMHLFEKYLDSMKYFLTH